jgi:ketosteroid isomerase-like protein
VVQEVTMSTTATAQRNVELARKGYQAFNDQDIETVNNLLNEDAVWHVGGTSKLAGDKKGRKAILEFFMEFGQITEGSYKADIHDILANDEHTIILGTEHATRGGKKHSARFVDVVHPDDDGKVKEFWRFSEDQAALDAFFAD